MNKHIKQLENSLEALKTSITKQTIQISEIEDKINRVKNSEKDWPNLGDKYFTFSSLGVVELCEFLNDSIDLIRKERGLCFRTSEEAKERYEKLIIYNKLMEHADGGDVVIRKTNSGELEKTRMVCTYGLPTFSSPEKAKEVAVVIGENTLKRIF